MARAATKQSSAATLKVTAIVARWDMRGVHRLRKMKATATLGAGECVVAFNRAETIGRVIDSAGGVHTYYAAKGESFDLESLADRIEAGFFVRIAGTSAKKISGATLRSVK